MHGVELTKSTIVGLTGFEPENYDHEENCDHEKVVTALEDIKFTQTIKAAGLLPVNTKLKNDLRLNF